MKRKGHIQNKLDLKTTQNHLILREIKQQYATIESELSGIVQEVILLKMKKDIHSKINQIIP